MYRGEGGEGGLVLGGSTNRRLVFLLSLPPHHVVVGELAPKNVERAPYRQIHAPAPELSHLELNKKKKEKK